ncbi:MAG: hypothetical protein JNM33_05530 [Rubrivivax sp.]|nr:hypothetical protein [Rubrivivax sp.]
MFLSAPWRRSAVALFTALALAPAAWSAEKSEGFSAGLKVQPRATLTDIGLPMYPGATPDKTGDEGEGASIQLWGGLFGMQLHTLAFKSGDAPDAVARFYREAMTRQGPLVDCSADAPPDPPPAAASQSKLLRCGKDRAKPGSHALKVGLPGGVRMVSIEPDGRGSRIQLVRLMIRGE